MQQTSEGRSNFAQLFKSSLAPTAFILFLVKVLAHTMACLLTDLRNT